VLLEDGSGKPLITKDGVTVADTIVLLDPVENMGATLLKEAARKEAQKVQSSINSRDLKIGIENAVEKVIDYLEKNSTSVKGDMIDQIATISTNNDPELGKIIGDAFRAVGETGVVMMEPSAEAETKVEIVDGIQYEKGITNQHFMTNQLNKTAELEDAAVLLVESPIENIRQIQSVLEHVIKNSIPLLIVYKK